MFYKSIAIFHKLIIKHVTIEWYPLFLLSENVKTFSQSSCGINFTEDLIVWNILFSGTNLLYQVLWHPNNTIRAKAEQYSFKCQNLNGSNKTRSVIEVLEREFKGNVHLYKNAAPQAGILKYGWKSLWKIIP